MILNFHNIKLKITSCWDLNLESIASPMTKIISNQLSNQKPNYLLVAIILLYYLADMRFKSTIHSTITVLISVIHRLQWTRSNFTSSKTKSQSIRYLWWFYHQTLWLVLKKPFIEEYLMKIGTSKFAKTLISKKSINTLTKVNQLMS